MQVNTVDSVKATSDYPRVSFKYRGENQEYTIASSTTYVKVIYQEGTFGSTLLELDYARTKSVIPQPLSVDSDRDMSLLLVGVTGDTVTPGTVYVYKRNGNKFILTQALKNTRAKLGEGVWFGHHVSVSKDGQELVVKETQARTAKGDIRDMRYVYRYNKELYVLNHIYY